ncbi:alpha/beta hydrolase [Conexibacter sp. SYSU D00693]|uniref:alpha/beta hydrolase n=1 Tax=Conexibacter sp. SYSU D00693 TaxID=2812560 RepID=UPI001F11A735|nr:alpha/beta hydrolase [Conexibacter sp. SYSU D00693]
MTTATTYARVLAAVLALAAAMAIAPALASAAAPDPMARGPEPVTTLDPFTAGTVDLQEPNAAGGAPVNQAAAATVQLRGSLYFPAARSTPSPIIVLVHGNHGSCDTGSAPNCTAFKRNDRGYAYLGENLASWGYTVLSLDQDQLMYYQDQSQGKGMHQRRTLIAGALDMLYAANQAPLADEGPNGINGRLVGKLDFSRIGLMGHSRGGDAVTSFIDYNRTRPEPGRRYALRGVISLAPVDYERRAPYGVPYLSILPRCDGDVSNLQGARFFERSQYVVPNDPFPKIQISVHGTNHNWFNSVWAADGEDSNPNDAACAVSQPDNLRLSGGKSVVGPDGAGSPERPNTGSSNGGTYTFANRGSGDPDLMGDQERVGLALMSSFFRRYVGGEAPFDEYLTGERSASDPNAYELPATACPNQQVSGTNGTPGGVDGTRIDCSERILTNYFAPAAERLDLIRPEPDTPLTVSALGTTLSGAGFSNPYTAAPGVMPTPAKTAGGYDWCNPEPDHFQYPQMGLTGYPTAAKPCPLPAVNDLGGQQGVRENGPVNQSYGLQLALAWDGPAVLGTSVPATQGDASRFKALTLSAAVNFFDPRNPARTGAALYDPSVTTQDFAVVLTDGSGKEVAVKAGDQRYGNALHPTPGTTSSKVHVVTEQIRIPLSDFAAQGLDLRTVRRVDLRFGEPGFPASGSIQLSDVRFSEAAAGATVFADTTAADGPAQRHSAAGPDPEAILAGTPREAPSAANPGPVLLTGAAKACAGTPALAAVKVGLAKGRLTARGKARASACAKLRSVQVAVSKAAGKGTCRFVTASGRLTKALTCATRAALVAKGTTSWRAATTGRLAKGRYRVVVRAIDAAGGVTQVTKVLRVA